MTNIDSIFKRDIALPANVCLVKAMVFPVVMYGCESWTIKKVECWKIDAFEMWCWRRLLRVPWATRRSNQSILKEISLEYSLEGLMLKLELQSFGHLMWRTDSLEKTLMLGKIEEEKVTAEDEMVGWHHWLDENGFGYTPGVGDRQGGLACCSPWGHTELDRTEWLTWTELNWGLGLISIAFLLTSCSGVTADVLYPLWTEFQNPLRQITFFQFFTPAVWLLWRQF